MEDEDKKQGKVKCPNCDEETMEWDYVLRVWVCSKCMYTIMD